MTRSSAGGSAAAGGVGHEGRCLAWVAVHMLAEVPLPGWASGRRVVAVGGQTDRPVDDVGLVTDAGGWVTIQAKKGLQLGEAETGPLAEALRQLVDISFVGVPDQPPRLDRLRDIDADRDLILILTDHSAPQTVDNSLAPVTERLRDLPRTVPLTDVPKNKGEERALRLVRDHLARSWRASCGEELAEADFRRLTKVLSVHTLYLSDEGQHQLAAKAILNDLAGDPEKASRAWGALLLEGQRLAEERSCRRHVKTGSGTYLMRRPVVGISR